MSNRRREVLLCVAMGLAIATAFTLWVTVIRLKSGAAPFERLGASYPTTVMVYYIGFAVGGLLVGLLFPLRKQRLGAAFLGFLFMLPMYTGFLIAKVPPAELLTPFWILSTLAASLLGGTLVGLWLWSGEFGGRAGSK